MLSVREGHVFVHHISLQIVNPMAALLKTARIADLGVRRAWPFPRKEISQRYLAINPLPLQMIQKTRLIVTFRTGNMLVTGSPPRLHIGIHLVTDSTEGGGFRKPEKASKDDQENNDARNKTDLDCLQVSSSPPPRLIEKIDPKHLDQLIKILYSSHCKASTQSLILQPFKIISRELPSIRVLIEGKWRYREKRA